MRARPAAGFTLIEIIVVVLVFSVMAAMAYGGLNSVLGTRRAIEDALQRSADLQRAYQRLRGDFHNLRDRPARDAFGDAQAPLTVDREGRLSLVRGGWRSPLHGGRSSLARVAYRTEDGRLLRATYAALDLAQDAKPVELTLLREVEELRWRFLDTGHEWQAQWPPETQAGSPNASTASQPPPLAVEITLVTRDWGELRFVFRTPQAGLAQGAADASGGSGLITREGLLPLTQLGVQREPADRDKTPPADPASSSVPESDDTDREEEQEDGDGVEVTP